METFLNLYEKKTINMSPEEFNLLSEKELCKFEKYIFVPPELGDNSFGYFNNL